MKTKRLWIARGKCYHPNKISFALSEMGNVGKKIFAEWRTINIENWHRVVPRQEFEEYTGLKPKPGQQIECKVTELKKGFKVEKV